ncbi:MAG: 50S ribosomal protein L10 [Candidatus Omnitrophica bacterium]|nr:50S ribosomal protein L10 [Candidatus Omnitrophota bacterium]
MPSLEKELMYKEIKERFDGRSIFFSSFDRLNIVDFEDLRKSVRAVKAKGYVVKKSLVKRYLDEINVTGYNGLLDGALFLTICETEPQKVSKALANFAKSKENFILKGAYIEGSLKDKNFVDALSKLPSREQLLGNLVCSMKAPITNFVFGLNAILRNFVVVVNEIKKQKETQAG